MLVKQKVTGFFGKCKNMPAKHKIISDATFKAWTFSSDFNFACEDGQVTAATCKDYCPFYYQLLKRASS